ncbi:hypothetical protein [Swingsia samuiensis]|uniref:XRE family transcriptional regulator n=1 Tax=Swingsia samuiensis TaxID=1293412 RepID=A0A4Y6UM66_9PROT|nr:hypothetical protein [Swingsia samuiensis]QDH17437.1 hypothetical protein E3D00_07570 [Swingsia samuiensis]
MEHKHDPVLPIVEAILARENITPTAFGMKSIGDPRLVSDLRNGRELRSSTRDRVFDFIRQISSESLIAHTLRPRPTSRKEAAHA